MEMDGKTVLIGVAAVSGVFAVAYLANQMKAVEARSNVGGFGGDDAYREYLEEQMKTDRAAMYARSW